MKLDQLCQHIVTGAQDTIVVGPSVCDVNDKPYFIVIYFSAQKGLWIERVNADQVGRSIVLGGIAFCAAGKGGRIIHDTGDELTAARLVADLWPCERSARLLANVEAEFRERMN